MKKYFLLFGLALAAVTAQFSISSHADQRGAPFMPESDLRFDAIEQGNTLKNCYPQGSCDGHWVQQLALATYDFAKFGGSSTANPQGLGAGIYGLGVTLPKNAIITETAAYSLTQPTTATSGTLAFQCQNANDIVTATAAASYGAAGAAINGASSGATAANFKYLTAACQMRAKIATGSLTAGKVTAIVNYWVHQ